MAVSPLRPKTQQSPNTITEFRRVNPRRILLKEPGTTLFIHDNSDDARALPFTYICERQDCGTLLWFAVQFHSSARIRC
jgi:hypothetical protein